MTHILGKKSLGFTLIELLVVISIIAILTAMGVVSYSQANKRSRDAKRKSDVEQVRQALEMYRADNGHYPIGACGGSYGDISCLTVPLVPTYIATIPSDSDTTKPYKFQLINLSGGQYYGYCISVTLETLPSGDVVEAATCSQYSNYNYTISNP